MAQVPELNQAICRRVNRMVGYHVTGLGDLLSVLTHPDVLPMVEDLIFEIKKEEHGLREATAERREL